jgi:CDP-glycerol glycerophosphotransferase (TagB/SpsB family)
MGMISEAAQVDPAAGHTQTLSGDILATMPGCDALITDVSSVGLDWLYLHTEKPIFLTDRHRDTDWLRQQVPISRCADVIDDANVDALAALLDDRLDHDEHHLARVAMRHHYFDDLHVGDSTVRFLAAVSEAVALRDQLIVDAGTHTAITA